MRDKPASGIALAFGPGLAMEGLRFAWTEGDAARRAERIVADEPIDDWAACVEPVR
jgi:hypothetical protein